ncbi:MAG TPA: hypothetical protein VFG89_10540 [Coriobacteriia bacterium]|nr:hypothetical protein [Coriobacteriia bacterium]
MNPGAFLIARIHTGDELLDLDWLADEGAPFEPQDPIDFLLGPEIQEAYELYRVVYSVLDAKLNVRMPEALLEYNRWVLIVDATGKVVGCVCFKTTDGGLKLGILATDGTPEAKSTAKRLIRGALRLDGVYAEVSGALERTLIKHVHSVPAKDAALVLAKPIEPLPDGFHYRRKIANVGVRQKIMVGLPHIPR